MKGEKLPKPIGDYVINNCDKDKDTIMSNNGTYIHYSKVCNLIKNYNKQWLKENIPSDEEKINQTNSYGQMTNDDGVGVAHFLNGWTAFKNKLIKE